MADLMKPLGQDVLEMATKKLVAFDSGGDPPVAQMPRGISQLLQVRRSEPTHNVGRFD